MFNRLLVSDFLLILLCLIPADLITDYLLPDRKYLCNETTVPRVTLPPKKHTPGGKLENMTAEKDGMNGPAVLNQTA